MYQENMWHEAEPLPSLIGVHDAFGISKEGYDDLIDILDDPVKFIEYALKIQDKRGDLVPFYLNEAQEVFLKEYNKQKAEGRPIRIIVLKARQLGFSTLISALFYHACCSTENTRAMIVAHKNDASKSIFEKNNLYYECSPEFFRPMRKKSNAREIVFENPTTNTALKRANPGLRSSIQIESAVNKSVARGKTIQYLHLSELAFWPYPEETMTSVMQAVPNLPGTAVVIESTANGIGNAFWEEWQRAEAGESEFVPVFFPWFANEEYMMPVPEDFVLTEDEEEVKAQYDLCDEQMVWRRWCISANCHGDLDQFHQEYPACPQEAFLASGRPVFDSVILEKAVRLAAKPKKIGRVVVKDGKRVFRTEYNGPVSLWEEPQEGRYYVIGADPASGDKNGDYSAAAVYDYHSRKQVAEWHGRIPPDVFGEELDALGRWYNNATLIPEANNHGVSVIDSLRRLHYPRLYRRRTLPDAKKEENVAKYGYWTSEQTKKRMIDNFAEFIRKDPYGIASKATLKECLTYVYDDRGSSNAQQGCHDDLVIANALAIHGLRQRAFDDTLFHDTPFQELYQNDSITGY